MTLLSRDDFEDQKEGAPPTRWEIDRGTWRIGLDEGRFLQQISESPVAAYALATWENYSIRARLKANYGLGNWGAGLVGYWKDKENHYRLCLINGKLVLLKVRGGQTEVLEEVHFPCKRGAWYRMHFRLNNDEQATELFGKLWRAGEPEPAQWTIQAKDVTNPLRSGKVGFWTGRCDAAFREVSVLSESAAEGDGQRAMNILYTSDFQMDLKGQEPSGFMLVGGKWVIDEDSGLKVCRQMQDQSNLSFRENAFAIVAWRDYTVQAKVKANQQDGAWAGGVVAYYGKTGEGRSFYALRKVGNHAFLVKASRDVGREIVKVPLPFKLEAGLWYHFKLQVIERGREGVLLRGKIWEGSEEPKGWLLEGRDENPLPGGDAGVTTIGSRCSFDDFVVVRNFTSTPSRSLVLQTPIGGYEGCEDVGSIQSAHPAMNTWDAPTFLIGAAGQAQAPSRGLIRFALSLLPTSALIQRARLELYATEVEGKPEVGLFRLLSSWVPEKVTWLTRNGERRWETPGGDFPGDSVNQPELAFNPDSRLGEEASVAIDRGGERWYSFDITYAVKRWVEQGADNFGLLIKLLEENGGTVQFATTKFPDLSKAPRLLIDYSLPQTLEQFRDPFEYRRSLLARRKMIAGPVRGFFREEPGKAGHGLLGEYFDDPDPDTFQKDAPPPGPFFQGEPKLQRFDKVIDFDWGAVRSPHPSMNSEFWSARWKGQLFVPKTDTYTFYLENLDDAGRLFIDGKIVIDAWKIQLQTTYKSEPIELTQGPHDLRLEYYQGSGPGASVKLSWSSGSSEVRQTIDFPDGIRGEYFECPRQEEVKLGETPKGPFFEKRIISRLDTKIDFDWNVTPHPSIGAQFWSVRWTGKLLVPETDEYTFYFERLDDAAKLYIDGNLVIDAWKIADRRNVASQPIRLEKGLHDIKIEYHQGPTPIASIRLSWSAQKLPKEIIPSADAFEDSSRMDMPENTGQ